jgi:hypothetical protein
MHSPHSRSGQGGYNHRIGLLGLVLGPGILAIGFLTHHAPLAGSLAMATILASAIAAYYYPASNRHDPTAHTDHGPSSR